MDKQRIEEAAALLRSGGLVAFPTETVYGLGADALNRSAVQRIYHAKGRPSTSPLIVHVSTQEDARRLARVWPKQADLLADRFWPGPLTLVLPKQPMIPDEVTAGLDSVGLRIPAHPVALALLDAAQRPIAAPSANRFMSLSPTTAAHVRDSLGDRVDLILDGGSTPVGIESTVLSLAADKPLLLRPGMIGQDEIEALIGPVERITSAEGAHPAPGLHARHYSPDTRLLLVRDHRIPETGRGVYVSTEGDADYRMPSEPRGYAAALYATLHELDQRGLDWIAVEWPPDQPAWAGIRDRLTRAASQSE